MGGTSVKLLAWFIKPGAEKRGGQIVPPNAPVLKTSREIPLPPVPQPKPPATVVMNVDLSGPDFERAVERAIDRIAQRRSTG